jgi:predicted PhzF superfamily epimerase YddE/YHI9
MKLPLYWVDAFTDQVFSGNPAAVVPLERWLDDALMQRVAFENGLAETAFFVRTGPARFQLRWFTPAIEVDLCGLATAFTIFTELGETADTITFESKSGPLHVSRLGNLLELDFPARLATHVADAVLPPAVGKSLGGASVLEWRKVTTHDYYLAVLSSAAEVSALKPDFALLASAGDARVIATAPGPDPDTDFVSRFFAPGAGVPEDPVTGSAHCTLTPYWAERLGKTKLHARQLSPRGGELWCELVAPRTGSTDAARVKIAGRGVLYLQGTITI